MSVRYTESVEIKKKDSAKQIVYGEVMTPMVMDSQGDFMTADQIEKTAHNFMMGLRHYNVDTEHSLVKNESVVIESFIARKGDPEFNEGSWVVGTYVPDKAVWEKVEKGELNAFSMYGRGEREDVVLEIEIPDDGIVKGETHENSDHRHQFFLKFDSNGKWTGETDEIEVGGKKHKHVIKSGTITESAGGHHHKYSLSDALAKIMKSQV
jgi:hypothetical protein